MTWIKESFEIILAAFVILLSFLLFFVIIFVHVETESKDIIIYLLGVLSAIDTQIVGYYFGSSKGSKDKTDAMNKAMNHGNQA